MAKAMSDMIEQGAAAVRELPADLGALYREDFGSWALRNAEALKAGDGAAVDWENLIKELEYSAESEPKTWRGNCKQTARHMLKIIYWDEDPERVNWMKKWVREIQSYREQMQGALNDHTVMKPDLQGFLDAQWGEGCLLAAGDLRGRWREGGDDALLARADYLEKQLDEDCPWTLVEVAGYNTETQDKKMVPSPGVLPAAMAKRLNREFHLKGDRAFNTSGWKSARERGAVSGDGLLHWPAKASKGEKEVGDMGEVVEEAHELLRGKEPTQAAKSSRNR